MSVLNEDAGLEVDPNWRGVLREDCGVTSTSESPDGALLESDPLIDDGGAWMHDFFASTEQEELQGRTSERPQESTKIRELSSTEQWTSPGSMPVSFGPGGLEAFPEMTRKEDTTKIKHEDVNTCPEQAIHFNKSESPLPANLEQVGDDLSQKIQSDEDVVSFLTNLQLVMAVPTVDEIRRARPLRKAPDEIYAAQLVLQAARRKAQDYFASEKGIREYHPHMQDGVFGRLDDGTHVIYQTNGVARIQEQLTSRQVKCDKTGAPGVYTESRMWVSRMREGRSRAGLKGAQSMATVEQIKANRFYSFISCMLWFACTGEVGELGEEDTGERVFLRRAARDFKQYWSHDFPIAKQLCLLLDHENQIMMKNFLYEPGNTDSLALVRYDCTTIRGWQTYEFDGKPPKDDAAVLLVTAARQGRTAELERLVLQKGLDINVVLSEFGLFGSGGAPLTKTFTLSDLAYAIEGTALIEAIRLGWASVVECIINFAQQGLANLDVVCSEWSPHGSGGPGLRQHYTALDIARLYHRKDIEALLLRANAKSWTECSRHKRENPFDVRANQESGQQKEEDSARNEDDFDDFSFADFEGVKMDEEMKAVTVELEKEIKVVDNMSDRDRFFRKLALRWHPDKHPDEKKGLATRIFQWIQHRKDLSANWEGRAWAT